MRRVGIAALSAMLLVACGGGSGGTSSTAPAGTPKMGGTLNVAQDTEINTLDPGASGLLVEREIYYNLYDSLLGIDPKLNFVAGLATAWKYTDPTTLVLTLRQGVRFQDGTDFNADTVQFNIQRYLTAPDSARKSELASVQSVEAQGPYTAVFHLKHSDGTLLAQLVDRAGMMLSPTAVKRLGSQLGVSPLGAGSGPFTFVEWKRDDHVTLKRNPDYWRKDSAGRQLPYLEQLVYHPMTDQSATLAALKTGQVDQVRLLAGKDIASVQSDSNLTFKATTGLNFTDVELNFSVPPFNDPAKARAVALGVDRAQIVKNVLFDNGVISHGPISPSSWAYDSGEKIYDRADPTRAKAAATGFSFTLKTANTQDAIQEGQLIQAQLAKTGITVNLLPEEFGRLTLETRVQHQFQAALTGWSGRIDPDGNMYAFYHTGGSFNDGLYSNPQVDSLLERARALTDEGARKPLYQEAQRILVQDVADVFIDHQTVYQASSNKVKGFTLNPDNINRFTEVWKA